MAKTVVGLFDSPAAARNAVSELVREGFRHEDISLMAKDAGAVQEKDAKVAYVEEGGHEQVEDMAKGAGTGAAIGGAAGLLLGLTALAIPGIGPILAAGPLAAAIAGAGLGGTAGGLLSGLTRLGLGDDDAHTYAEGLKRGGTILSVETDDREAERAVAVLKKFGAAEIDKRAAEWRGQGWTGFDAASAGDGFETYTGGGEAGREESERARVAGDHVALPVVEERLEVSKREVARGGVRVESRVTETPVEEDVRLRDERVRVERLPADYTFHGAESEAFKEAVIEFTESHEELSVNKKARVVEEVRIGKEFEEHTETVRETLRHSEVEVEPLEPGRARGASAAGEDAGPLPSSGRRPGDREEF
ncbi:MAG TPA: YsnF/AvaK domain-containing protein [Pyrinomonadaceae bacterium]